MFIDIGLQCFCFNLWGESSRGLQRVDRPSEVCRRHRIWPRSIRRCDAIGMLTPSREIVRIDLLRSCIYSARRIGTTRVRGSSFFFPHLPICGRSTDINMSKDDVQILKIPQVYYFQMGATIMTHSWAPGCWSCPFKKIGGDLKRLRFPHLIGFSCFFGQNDGLQDGTPRNPPLKRRTTRRVAHLDSESREAATR